ncbi:hypothetical protein ACHHYP_16295 [Achlya hypogyna]|uniref:Transmembrane protein n=1 Tax=Achlya hypogyna TaxID=1202772 RepID=A0A1V9Y967_ACHHY|nr:hypothetical protein ACHHYP_16295 [Achlya hypogyna]
MGPRWRHEYVAVRRLLLCVAALVMLYIEVRGSIATKQALLGVCAPAQLSNVYTSPLVVPFLASLVDGTASLRALAPGAQLSLVYVDAGTNGSLVTSLESCSDYRPSDAMYNRSFVAPLLWNLLGTWHAVDLSDVAVVIDCQYTGRAINDTTALKLHLVDPTATNVTTVFLQTMLLSRPTKFMTEASGLVNVLTAPVAGVVAGDAPAAEYLHLLGIEFPFVLMPFERIELHNPREPMWAATVLSTGEQVVVTGTDGVYRESPQMQGNYDYYNWALPTDPRRFAEEIAYWAAPCSVDCYAWVRCLLGMGVTFNLGSNILVAVCIVVHLWLTRREVWIPDLYPSIQRRIQLRALLLLGATISNNCWHVFEYCLQMGNAREGINQGFVLEDMVRSDGLTYLLSLAVTLTDVLETRLGLDVLVAIYVVCLSFRLQLVEALHWGLEATNVYLAANYVECIVAEPRNPMSLWAYHANLSVPTFVLTTELAWFIVAVAAVVAYAVAAKASQSAALPRGKPYRIILSSRFESLRARSARVLAGGAEVYSPAKPREAHDTASDTAFERRTRRSLVSIHGVVAPFEAYVVHDGVITATPSAIWLLGYVILNEHFVLEIRDYAKVAVNLLLRTRVFRVYCFRIHHRHNVDSRKESLPLEELHWRDLNAYVHARRLLSCVAAAFVLYVELTGSIATRRVMHGVSESARASAIYKSVLIAPFVAQIVHNRSRYPASHQSFWYLDESAPGVLSVRNDSCLAPTPSDAMYEPPFLVPLLRNLFGDGTAASAYDVVVDCQYDGRLVQDTTALKFHLLDPARTNVTTVVLQTMTMERRLKHSTGACGVASVATTSVDAMTVSSSGELRSSEAIVHTLLVGLEFPYVLSPFLRLYGADMSTPSGRWTGTLPTNEPVTVFGTVGVYRGSMSVQANYGVYNWALSEDPIEDLTTLHYFEAPMSIDCYAWVRWLLGLGVSLNLCLNMVVAILIVCNIWHHQHQLWIPDLYPSVQRRIQLRALLLLGATIYNDCWHVFEYCLQMGSARERWHSGFVLDDMVRSDGLTYLLSLAVTLADVLETRLGLDVLVAIYVMCLNCRLQLLQTCGWCLAETNAFLAANYVLDIVPNPMGAMSLWAAHENFGTPPCLLVTELTWFLVAAIVATAYALCSKAFDAFGGGPRAWSRTLLAPRTASWLSGQVAPCPPPARGPATGTYWRRRLETVGGALADVELLTETFGVVAPFGEAAPQAFVSPSGIWLLGYLVLKEQLVIEIADYPRLLVNLALDRRFFRVYGYSIRDGSHTSSDKTLLDHDDVTLYDLVACVSLRPLQ